MGRLFSIGEALIDFIPLEPKPTLAEVEAFAKRPGGAPANVAVAAAKLGSSANFVGMVGDDPFGHFLIDTISGYGVNVDFILLHWEKTGPEISPSIVLLRQICC